MAFDRASATKLKTGEPVECALAMIAVFSSLMPIIISGDLDALMARDQLHSQNRLHSRTGPPEKCDAEHAAAVGFREALSQKEP